VSVSKRLRRKAPIVVALALLAGLLAACQKPLPTITVFGDGKSVIIAASQYQFAGAATRTTNGDAHSISVQAGSSLLVDVPRAVAKRAWAVQAYSVDSSNKATYVAEASSPVITDKHSTRVSSSPMGVGTYVLRISEYRENPNTPTGVWLVQVHTTG
jgi:hypothetical protein